MTHTTYRIVGVTLIGVALASILLVTAMSSDAGTGQVQSCFRKAVTGTVGTPGNDVIRLTDGDDTIDTMGGNDRICGRQGDDEILAGGGNDRIRAGQGEDFVNGGGDDDVIRGNGGDDGGLPPSARGDLVESGLIGGSGDDEIGGGTGNDGIVGQGGVDFIDGGQQFDDCFDDKGTTFERCENVNGGGSF